MEVLPKALALVGEAEDPSDRVEKRESDRNSTEDVKQQDASTSLQHGVPFSVWSDTEKKFIVFAASVAAFFSPVSGHIYFPALNRIAEDLKVSNGLITLSITTYMLMQGLAPAFIGEFSDNAGRRPAYLVCGVLYVATNIGLALQSSYAGLLVLRCLQSAGSSGTVSLVYAVAADLVTSSERGRFVIYAAIPPQLGPTIGPVIGGVLADHKDWHFIFWFLVILAGVVFVPMALFLPETCRKIVGNGSISPGRFNRCITNKLHEKRLAKGECTFLGEKECGLILVYVAIVFSQTFGILAMLPSQLNRVYGFNEIQIALCYIPLGVGTVAAALIRGPVMDSRFRYYAKTLGMQVVKNRKVDLTNFPIERARIEIALPTIFLNSLSGLVFGWTLHYETNLAGPLISLFAIGFCVSATGNTFQVLLIDLYPERAGAISAANNLLRCWLGAGATALVIPMIEAVGLGWTCTLFSLVILAFTPLLWVIVQYGPVWRRELAEKQQSQVDSDP